MTDLLHRAENGVRSILAAVGEDPTREGLIDTPSRVVKALLDMTSGHRANLPELLKTSFEAGAYDEAVVVAPIAFASLCEHHLLPFVGHAAVAYLPAPTEEGKYRVVGLSKIPRVVEAFSRRLQLQERMTTQIGESMVQNLDPRGVAVIVRAEHSCMSCRGVRAVGARMVTSAMYGVFRDNPSARAEVLALIEKAWA